MRPPVDIDRPASSVATTSHYNGHIGTYVHRKAGHKMGSKVKAILLDVDGTLTNDKKVITPRTREALLACQERGVTLVLASGRTQGGLARYAADLDLAHHGGVLV